MKRKPSDDPRLKGEYPKVPPSPPPQPSSPPAAPALPPREGLEGVPEEIEPWTGQRWVDVLLVLAAAAGSIALLGWMAWWIRGGR